MKVPDGLKFEITPEMVYPNGVPDIPEGYEFERFGYVAAGDTWLRWVGLTTGIAIQDFASAKGIPAIILREKPQPKRRWVVEFYGDLAHADHDPNGSPFGRQVNIIREVKPITRQRLGELCAVSGITSSCPRLISPIGMLEGILRSIGIEVEP